MLDYLKTLFPLCDLSLKMSTLKVVAPSAAPRAQTLISLHIDSMKTYENRVSFVFHDLLKTSRPNQNFQLNLYPFGDEKICPMHTVLCLRIGTG